MEFKQYPSYKNSGVEWLGDVPEHWSYSSLKYALRQKKGAIKSGPFGSHLKSSDMVYSDVKVINQKNVIDKDFIGGNNFISFDKYEELKSFTICPKDILITTRGTIGKIAQVTESLPLSILHPCLIRIQVDENKVLFEFINYFFECEKLSLEQLKFVSNAATIDVIYCENLANIYLPIPPIIEQRAITKFLDTETARIDNLISKQQKLIKLLEEQRKSIISYAVTKGLNPNAPMKNSGVEWLGEVPEHWSYSSLKYVLKQKKGAIKSGPFGSHLKSSDMVYSDVKVINQRNVIDKDFIGGDNFISFEKYEELKSFTIYPKDVLVTTRGTIGKVAQVAEDLPISILHPCLIRIQVDENKVLFDYINYFFECEKLSLEQLRYASNAATIDVIYCENLASIYLPIPSISEQNEIIKYLKDEDIKINKLISKQKTLIEKLKEYRSSIISHAVTGKIDVREWGA